LRPEGSDDPLAPLHQKKIPKDAQKQNATKRKNGFKKQMDSKRKQEGDGFAGAKKLRRRM
jgi:hypothetical protein